MGLFNFRKPKSEANMMPAAFLEACIADFHQEAAKYGVAKKGNIFVPELMAAGEKIVLTFLKDSFLKMEYGNNPGQYYYVLTMFVWESGLAFAAKWHKDISELDNYVNNIGIVGPADDANKLLKEYFPASISANQGNGFLQKIYPRFLEMYKPYENLSDPRKYVFNGLLAAYQLGVSMMLEKLGY